MIPAFTRHLGHEAPVFARIEDVSLGRDSRMGARNSVQVASLAWYVQTMYAGALWSGSKGPASNSLVSSS